MKEIGRLDDLNSLLDLFQSIGIEKFLGSAVASLVGAYFAFRFAIASAAKKNYATETQAVNYAFSVVYSYLNSAHNIKKQLLLPKLAELESITQRLEELHANMAANLPVPEVHVIEYKNTFLEMQPVEFMLGSAVKALSALQYMTGRPTIFSFQLEKSAASLNHSISGHNETIVKLKEIKDHQEVMFSICGFVQESGSVDTKYRNHIEACISSTDELLYFSSEILKDLTQHLRRLKTLHDDKHTKALSVVPEDESDELMPPKERFSSWETVPVVFSKIT